jgi:hypothetical protein
MQKRQKGTVIPSGNYYIDQLRVNCINKILLFDDSIDFDQFDFLFGSLKNRPKRLIKLLISLDCLPNLEEISEIIFNNKIKKTK